MKIMIPLFGLVLCGCAAQPQADNNFWGTYTLPSGRQVIAETQRLNDGTIGMTLRPETVPQRYTNFSLEMSQLLLLTETAPANAACAPQRAERIESVFDERTEARLSRWRCIS